MAVVLDANVLLRMADPTCAAHATAVAAVRTLLGLGEKLRSIPQSIYEYWAVATRPIANNGLGLSTAECSRDIATIKAMFPVLGDLPTLFSEWEAVVAAFACHGKISHDARYVAAMRTLGLTRLLTFNVVDFSRFSNVVVLDPALVIAVKAPPTP